MMRTCLLFFDDDGELAYRFDREDWADLMMMVNLLTGLIMKIGLI
jgi:hypothetical protein